MRKWILWFPLKLLGWGLGVVGAAALVLTAMIASPLQRLPELTSVSQAARAVDRSTMPSLERFSARDGTVLAYRHYPAQTPSTGRIAVVVHGSSGSSQGAIHALAPTCAHCPCRIIGHGIEARGAFYCCAHCAKASDVSGVGDRA